MRVSHCLLTAAICLGIATSPMLVRGAASVDDDPWQPIVPKEAYQELVKREAEQVRDILAAKPDAAALRRASFGAILIGSYTRCAKDVPQATTDGTMALAVQLSTLLGKNDLDGAKTQAVAIIEGKSLKPGADLLPAFDAQRKLLTKADLMDHFNVKAKKGDGIHPDLQSNIRLKGALNGIEEKIRGLTLKELTAAGMKKESKELELLAYRCAVVGALTYLYAPATKAAGKDPAEWRKYSLQSRDAGQELAIASAKSDAAGVLKASNALSTACSQCHVVFRQQ
jgi:hypothetical protein